jgi:AraC-like DNA-binding protein
VLSLSASVDDPVHQVVALLSREMLLAEPGRQTVLDRLLDVLVVLGLRAGLDRDLLLAQEASMDEIAAQVGYSSVYAFATAFRRHHGEPPRRWQQRETSAAPAGEDLVHSTHT